jgi:hypothetical protein
VSVMKVHIPEFDLLVPKKVVKKYKACHTQLKRELQLISLKDHIWSLKLNDSNGIVIVKLQCRECEQDFGGTSGDHSKSTKYNIFANFKESHVMSNAHVRAWCKRKGIPWMEHP